MLDGACFVVERVWKREGRRGCSVFTLRTAKGVTRDDVAACTIWIMLGRVAIYCITNWVEKEMGEPICLLGVTPSPTAPDNRGSVPYY